MKNSIGAEQLIHIVGHYGIITSSTISTYNGIDNEWNWIGKTDTPAANDYNEIEVLGNDGNYYFYVKSWDNEKDDIEAEIYSKVTLPDEEGDDGSRAGTPTFPTTWTSLGDDADEGLLSDVEILELYYATDSDYVFFKIVTEANVDITDSTFGVIIDDVSINSGTYEIACTSYKHSSTNARGYTYSWSGTVWELAHSQGTDWDDHIQVNNGHSGIQLACDKDDLGFTIDTTNDKIRAISTDADSRAFRNDWEGENVPSTDRDDITDAVELGIPEFSTLMMPVASVLLIIGNKIRTKKTTQQ